MIDEAMVTASSARASTGQRVVRSVGDAWRREREWALPALALFAWLSVLAFLIPVDYDEAVYALVSRGLVSGHWPYRDLFDNKPPLVYVWFLPAGITHSLMVQRIFGAAIIAASVRVMASVGRAWLPRPQARFAPLGYAVFLANPFIFPAIAIETYVLLPLLASFVVASPVVAGVLLGVAVMTKPTALFFLPVLLLRFRWRSVRVLAGMALVVGAVALAFTPVWHDFWTANVTFNRQFTAWGDHEYPVTQRVWSLLIFDFAVASGGILVLVMALFGAFHTRSALVWVCLACGALALKANVYTTGFDTRHYYLLLAPGAAALIAVSASRLTRPGQWRFRAICAGMLGLAVAASVLGLKNSPAGDDDLVRVLSEQPGELYVLASRPVFYYRTDHPPQRRVFFPIAFKVRPDWEASTRADLEACPPAMLVRESGAPLHDAAAEHFRIPWASELDALYAHSRTFGKYVLLTEPLHPCDRATVRGSAPAR